jgi:hypothetical protein
VAVQGQSLTSAAGQLNDTINNNYRCLQLNILAHAADFALIGENETEIRKLFVEMENIARKFGLQINQEKTKYVIAKRKKSLMKNKIGDLKIKKLQI